ncbi:hypothetical protein VP01_1139g2 [Puccinia sorghi]|uniref:Uncharacterized protein n=1 Tax=Puccinia sorghi TaxID=27349 RepID=A0A0L6VTE5_9BASI|nr:hypothetical protein VP01_1139g2 [Puccinia sorghi]
MCFEGLRRKRKDVPEFQHFGVLESLPKGDIKCPVCMIAKGTRYFIS